MRTSNTIRKPGWTYLFKVLVTQTLLSTRCGRHRSLALFASSSGALCFLLDGLDLLPSDALSLEHLMPQLVCQFSVLWNHLANTILRYPVVPASLVSSHSLSNEMQTPCSDCRCVGLQAVCCHVAMLKWPTSRSKSGRGPNGTSTIQGPQTTSLEQT